MERKWAYKPGERSTRRQLEEGAIPPVDKLQKFLELTESYTQHSGTNRTLVLSDNKEIVFFVQVNENFTRTKQTDVFVWNGIGYRPLSESLGNDIATKYFDYLDTVSLAYSFIEGDTQQ